MFSQLTSNVIVMGWQVIITVMLGFVDNNQSSLWFAATTAAKDFAAFVLAEPLQNTRCFGTLIDIIQFPCIQSSATIMLIDRDNHSFG